MQDLRQAAIAPHSPLPRYYADERQRRTFVREIFDSTAGDYDRVERAMALGSGSRYRREALQRAGLTAGMKVLDVAVGTGLVAREAITLCGNSRLVFGVDPSAGMLAEAVRQLDFRAIRGAGEQLPIGDNTFDFLSMGYAMRHLSDLTATFSEFHRVLRPGGTACVLEITRPERRMSQLFLRWYMRRLVPFISRLRSRTARSPLLWEYYADTIEACISPETVMQAMHDAGFIDVKRHVQWGVFSEYTGRKAS